MSDITTIGLIALIAITVIVLLIRKNIKDKKRMNPDAQDSVEETMMDQERRKDKL